MKNKNNHEEQVQVPNHENDHHRPSHEELSHPMTSNQNETLISIPTLSIHEYTSDSF